MISSVRKREQILLNNYTPFKSDVMVKHIYQDIITNKYVYENAKIVLNNWENLDTNQNIALAKVLNVMEQAYINGNTGNINSLTYIVCENVIPKVRDAEQMQYHIKRKLANIKTKINTKINNKIEDLYNAIQASKPQTPATNTAQNNTQQSTTEAIDMSINRILEASDNIIKYDRIINNYNKLCKRFNIDRFTQESVFSPSMVGDWVLEFCKLIDTYEIPTRAKYTICLENALYALDKNGVPYIKKDIVNNITNYFLSFNNEDWRIFDIIIKAIKSTNFYDDKDTEDIDFIIKRKYKPEQDKLSKDGDYDSFFNSEKKFTLTLESAEKNIKTIELIKESAIKNRAKEIFEKFKSIPNASTTALTAMIRALFSQDDRNIIEEYPNVLQYIFGIFVVSSSIAISPILGAIALGTTLFINMHMQRKETERFISIYKKNKEKAEKRLKTLKDQKSKERCEAYIKQLEKDISKLEDYQDGLLSDDEKAERDQEKYTSDIDFGDLNFDESTVDLAETLICNCSVMEFMNNIIEGKIDKKDPKKAIKKIEKSITNMNCDDLDIIKEFSLKNPFLIDPSELAFIYDEHYNDIKKTKSLQKYIKMDCLKENVKDLENYKESENYDIILSLSEMYNDMITYDAINEYLETKRNSILLEVNFGSDIQILIDRIKKSAIELSDKEKIMSRTLDASLERLKNSMENALTQENKEAVIRGSIIPPASKCIKLAITSGVTWMISPILTIIYLLGTFAMSANIQAKERQIILDELDVELTMCDKYIRIAEDNNELDKLRKLLMIKKKLEAQRNRLKYKMDIEWRTQSNPSSEKEKDDY